MAYKLGSLFDGSGGFPLAASLEGVEPVWAAEVKPYPIAVTRERFPRMKHLGNVSKINGAEIEPVDIITFGSPCQDLSVAGKRAGLKHEDNGDEETTRSGLFMEAVRIIKEMREATDGRYPRFALWENVPGAFSSRGGEDFRTVLEELVRIAEPDAVMPAVPKGGWPYADSYLGDGWSLAYRTFDAQYWGVPQRRRRIHLVADFGGECARKVLFEREGVRGYFAQSRTPWQGAQADAEGGVGADDREGTAGDGVRCYDIGEARLRTPAVYDARENGDGKTVSTITGDHENRITDYSSVVVEPDRNDVIYALDRASFNQGKNAQFDFEITDSGINSTIVGKGPSAVAYGIGNGQANQSVSAEVVGALNCMHDQQAVAVPSESLYIVRRLTPNECNRLQGFADGWGVLTKKTELTE